MGRIKKVKQHSHCLKSGCGLPIPDHKRSDSQYCSDTCRESAEKKRYCDRNPDYVKRQRRLVNELRHIETYGHTEYLDNPMQNPNDRYARARALGYRSGLEVKIAKQLDDLGIEYGYESIKIEWEDLSYRVYTPDIILDNGIIIETKGRFMNDDRRKHIAIKEQHPELDIRFVFTNASALLYKGAKSRYCDWCDKYGFKWSHRIIPKEWLVEKGEPITIDRIPLKTKRKK